MPTLRRVTDVTGPCRTLLWLGAVLVSLLPLPGRAVGNLPAGATPCAPAPTPAGYGSFLLMKHGNHLQFASGLTNSTSIAGIDLLPPAAYAISNAIATGPANFKAPLTRQPDGSSIWFDTGPQLSVLPQIRAGAWNMSFQLSFTNGEAFFGFFPFLLVSNVPPIPQIANFDAAQSIDSKSTFNLSWNAWIGSGTNDRVALIITDTSDNLIVSTATDCAGDTDLPRGSTSIAIPAGKLAPNKTYIGYLTFGASLLSATDESSLIVQRAFESHTTRFTLRTSASTGGTAATFLNPSVSGTNLVFTLKGSVGDVQRIDSTADFATWTQETQVTIPAGGTIAVTLPLPAGGAPRFYRAVALGGGTVTGEPARLTVALAAPRDLDITVAGTAGATYNVELTVDGSTWNKVAAVTIPAAGTPQVARVTVPDTADYALVRAVAVAGTTPPPVVLLSPTLSLTRVSATSVRLVLTNGTPRKTYTIQQSSDGLKTWNAFGPTVSTGTNGAATTTFFVFPVPGTGRSSTFYRAYIK